MLSEAKHLRMQFMLSEAKHLRWHSVTVHYDAAPRDRPFIVKIAVPPEILRPRSARAQDKLLSLYPFLINSFNISSCTRYTAYTPT